MNTQDFAGRTLIGSDQGKIGKIVDVYESTDGSGATFATVSTGLFGSGASFFPLAEASVQGEDVVVPYTKDFVKDAPRVDNDEELTAAEEARLFTYYNQGQTQQVPAAASTGSTDDAMTRSEERMQVGTETVETGRARLRKYVVTETEQRTVPVSHEEVHVEREPITDANRDKALQGAEITEGEYEVALHEERPVVATETVPVERVRLDTDTVTEQAAVSKDLRKEQIEADGVYPEETRTTQASDAESNR
jgi:uncharacterized protein (TIGR02271 family)